MVVCITFTRNSKYGSRLWILETRNIDWKDIELDCTSFRMWRNKILSNYRSVRKKNQYATENAYLRWTRSNYIVVNAVLINWEKEKFYAFPPFVCLSKTLLKIYQDKAKGIPFYPRLIETFLLNYFYSSQKIKLVSTKPTFNASTTSQKIITASLLSNGAMMGQWCINEGCKRRYHQFMGRKNKKSIQDILRSIEKILPRSQF